MNAEKPTGVSVVYTPIGVVHSDRLKPEETPIQPRFADDCTGWVEVFPQYAEGLKDLNGFSHIIVISHLHRAEDARLIVRPFMEDVDRGVFATRHPRRPNPIGLSTVRLLKMEGSILYIQGVDMLDGTPVLDIKPYVPRFDHVEESCPGWTGAVPEEEAYKRGRRGLKKN